MSTIPQLENYLSQLDKALAGISTSEKADIVLEIKSHVMEAMEKDSKQSVDTILTSLGDPKTVANRFLLERGLKPVKPSVNPFFKWLVIGFLGTVGLTFLLVIIILFKFTPIIKVDETNKRVQILGGLIDIQDNDLDVNSLKEEMSEGSFNSSGSQKLDLNKVNSIFIPFKMGKLSLQFVDREELSWDCKLSGKSDESLLGEEGKNLKFKLDWYPAVKCEMQIPAKLKVSVKGEMGKIVVTKPKADFDLEVGKGKVQFIPDASKKYNYDIKVITGKVDEFESSNDKDAIQIRMKVEAGKISQ